MERLSAVHTVVDTVIWTSPTGTGRRSNDPQPTSVNSHQALI